MELIQELRELDPAGIAAYTMCGDNPYEASGLSAQTLFVGHRPGPQCHYIGFDYLKSGQ